MRCKSRRQNTAEIKCPMCKRLGEAIHYLVVKTVVKKEVEAMVINEEYYTCRNNDCQVIIYNHDHNRVFLIQDINLSADFNGVTKDSTKTCGGSCGNGCQK
ncbi:hypothetical protein F8154_02475 [Alkaliphilus pronyensis]|uniref:CopZ zinc binding domain-containing protein n=1 Tax=Alkaliphilus pronyensis TaxID=1482732 RepID=A0A6I0FMX8_9FIRM|nr:hypothetical protein [Alkaliphilus pronyensis]KAB3537694.1 hypothetical protein F8154_02475 [Alkaliphilus pronyensis]